jgi:hypothetical protein
MKKILSKYPLTFIGILVGAVGGFFYWKYVGCTNGCPMQSNPYRMTAYGAVMGGLVLSMFQTSGGKI